MSLGHILHTLRHGFSLEEAEARINDWWQRGMVQYSDLATRSTKITHVGSDGHGVIVLPAAVRCATGCGWERWERP